MRLFRLETPAGGTALGKALDAQDAVAIRPGVAESMPEFRLAHHLAERAFAEKSNLARQMRYEFLLWLAGKTDIRSAMRETAPEIRGDGPCEIIVAAFQGSRRGRACPLLPGARRLPMNLKRIAMPLALERISLSRIGK